MSELLSKLTEYGPQLAEGLGYAVSLATVIVLATPNKKDDKILGKVVGLLHRFSLLKPKADVKEE